jgi:hypothetical protein
MTSIDATPEPLHLVTQRGQPYGSVRRCCEQCGRMCWPGRPGSAERWTDDPVVFDDAENNCQRRRILIT